MAKPGSSALRRLERFSVGNFDPWRPLNRLNRRKALQQFFDQGVEALPCQRGLTRRNAAAQLFEKNALLRQIRLRKVREILRAHTEFEERLIALPAADPAENRHEQREEQDHRRRDIRSAPRP